jgi:hypothetical protein
MADKLLGPFRTEEDALEFGAHKFPDSSAEIEYNNTAILLRVNNTEESTK